MGSSSAALTAGDAAAELSVPSFGFAFAKVLKKLDASRLSAGGGLGVDSLLEGLLGICFSFALLKNSLALKGCCFVSSVLGAAAGAGFWSAGLALEGWVLVGTGAAAEGGGLRTARRRTFGFTIVPYFANDSRGSSFADRSLISRVTSDSICRSYFE